jgi:ATPase subunit of ABC transporter with duplicated ATPase domains
VIGPEDRLYCDQQAEVPPAGFDDFLNAWDETSLDLMRRLGVEYEWYYRWETLSFGERTRAKIATAVWRRPEVLAVDEPTNHLDIDARRTIGDALARWDGIGIIVSHDRELLDRLCTRCLFLSGGTGVMRPGGISEGMEQERREHLESVRVRENAAREARRLRREAQRRTEAESRSAGRLSKRGVSAKDHDTRAKVDAARLTGKDRRASDTARLMRERAADAVDRAHETEVRRPTFVGNTGSLGLTAQPARGDALCRIDAGEVTHADGAFSMAHPELTVAPGDRIGISGPNGSGKSTFLRSLIREISQRHSVLVISQELSTTDLQRVRNEIDELDRVSRGRVLAMVTQLGSDAERVLDTPRPSPGEARKLLLALGVLEHPAAIVMDEPTNHLDLPSMTALESTLREYAGALIVISHDERFLATVATTRWYTAGTGSPGRFEIRACSPTN